MSVIDLEKAVKELSADDLSRFVDWFSLYQAQAGERKSSGLSVFDFVQSLPEGPRSAPTWDQVAQQLKNERDSWG